MDSNLQARRDGVFLVLAGLFLGTLGMLNIRLETDPQNLWVSHDSTGYQQEMNFNQQFGAFFRTEQIIMAQNQDAQLLRLKAKLFPKKHQMQVTIKK